MVTTIIIILLFLLLSAFFSGSEIAFISASKLRVELLREEGHWKGKLLTRFFDRPKEFLATMLVGNNIALVVFTYFMTILLGLGDSLLALLINTLTITAVVLLFGEFLPKTLFRLFADRAISIFAIPLQFFRILLSIPTWIMTKLSGLLIKMFSRDAQIEENQPFTRVDLVDFVEYSVQNEDEIDTDLFKNALHLSEIKVRECMVPRNEIVAVEVNADIETVKKAFDQSKLSRILVYGKDIDDILGYIHHQQLLKSPRKLKTVVSDLPFVPEVMNIHTLMNKFIREEKNIACVVDEYGGIAGVITLEDILEEIFGEIEDEHDLESHIELHINDDEWLFSGRLEIDYLNEKYSLNFPKGEYNTLSGYIVMTTASIPEEGDTIVLEKYRYILEHVSDTRIETVRVQRIFEDPDG